MPTLAELARRHSALDEDKIAHLQDLTGSWGLLADLSFADLLLYAPTSLGPGASLVLLGHVRPTTAATIYRADLVGQSFDPERRPLIGEAMDGSRIVTGVVSGGLERDINLMAVPVNRCGETIAVLGRERTRPADRPRSELERTYLAIFDRFASMLEQGGFPYPGEDRFLHRTPRVGDGLLLVDQAGRIEFASPNAVSLLHRLGWHRAVVGARVEETGLGSTMLRSAFTRCSSVIDEMERGNEVTVVSHCFPFLDEGCPTGAVVLVRDVTELRRRDRQLISKDATIREIHHRVKNNLQAISSLLRLQARRLGSAEAKDALEESVRRIAAIAVVHETLAQSTDGEVAFDEIVRPLVAVVEDGLSSPLRPVEFLVEGDAGVLPARVTTTLAVVVTELLQNAVEHAFSNKNGGRVSVVLGRDADGLRVRVLDDGTGLPTGFTMEEGAGLGLTIVRTFVEGELNGSVELRTVADALGTIAEILVPAESLLGVWDAAQEPVTG
ncbi:MAG: sensor histidine kinase [Actinomycetota bacterium]|nr:sensor histidine kinase [Actinomycetota bacterium]